MQGKSVKKVLGIVGSYRKDGIIDSAVTSVLRGAAEKGAEVEKIYLLDYRIEFCRNCRSCMQEPGLERGKCVIEDDLEILLKKVDSSEYLVIGAPVNCGNLNALTRRFMERCVGYGYWPWGKPVPKGRIKSKPRKSVLVSSSAAPFLIGRYFTGAVGALKQLSELLGAKPSGVFWEGLVNRKNQGLSERSLGRSRKLGMKLVG